MKAVILNFLLINNLEINEEHISTNILISTTFFNIYNNRKSPNRHIKIISEWSCDTEDWSNDAENSALHHKNKLHITKY